MVMVFLKKKSNQDIIRHWFVSELVEICDIVHIYDNTNVPFRIFKKRKDIYFHWENKYWSYSDIEKLTGISEYSN